MSANDAGATKSLQQLYRRIPADCKYIVMRFAGDSVAIEAHKCVCRQLEYNLREFNYLRNAQESAYFQWPSDFYHKFTLIRAVFKTKISQE